MKKAVVLFNLGGPDKLENVEPFLFNLFNDPAILNLPRILRYPLAKLIANRRAPTAKKIYQAINYQIEHGPYDSEPIYGDGNAGEKIADTLSKCTWTLQKKITY